MSIPFWYNDPSILLNKKHIFCMAKFLYGI